MSDSTATQKHLLRQHFKKLRQQVNEASHGENCRAICERIAGWAFFQQAGVILTYLPIKSEVDLRHLFLTHPDKKWCLPRLVENEKRMQFHPYDPQKLVRHRFGMDEPSDNLPIVAPNQIQLTLVPGLAYDLYGRRLGYGGGYYDRFLPNFTGVSLGVTLDELVVDHLPGDDFDVPVNFVVTQTRLTEAKQQDSSNNCR